MHDDAPTGSTPLLNIPESAAALQMSERWVWGQVSAGKLPVVRLGRRVRVRTEDLEAFIAAHIANGAKASPRPRRGGLARVRQAASHS
jgi:excisionase family DNA binding protein